MKIMIYVLKHPITKEIRYVGKTSYSLKDRLKGHLRDKRNNHRTGWLKNLAKQGLQPIIEQIDFSTSLEESSKLERFYIKDFKEKGFNLINSTEGGEGTIGRVITKEQRDKQSKALKGKFSGSKNPFYNKKHTEESKDKIRQKRLGTKATLEQNLARSIMCKISGKKVPLHGIEKVKEVCSKIVIQYDLEGNFIKEWKSMAEAARNGFDQPKISNCCNGKVKKHKGFIWKFKEII